MNEHIKNLFPLLYCIVLSLHTHTHTHVCLCNLTYKCMYYNSTSGIQINKIWILYCATLVQTGHGRHRTRQTPTQLSLYWCECRRRRLCLGVSMSPYLYIQTSHIHYQQSLSRRAVFYRNSTQICIKQGINNFHTLLKNDVLRGK